MYKTMPRIVAARGIIVTTELHGEQSEISYFNIIIFFERKSTGGDLAADIPDYFLSSA